MNHWLTRNFFTVNFLQKGILVLDFESQSGLNVTLDHWLRSLNDLDFQACIILFFVVFFSFRFSAVTTYFWVCFTPVGYLALHFTGLYPATLTNRELINYRRKLAPHLPTNKFQCKLQMRAISGGGIWAGFGRGCKGKLMVWVQREICYI